METIIEKLKKTPIVNVSDDENKDLAEQLQDAIEPDSEVHTALGSVFVQNKTGNMQLQMEIDDFLEALKSKYS